MDFLGLERFAMKHMKGDALRPVPVNPQDVAGLTAMLDYAIMEGAQMRLPLFVCLLRLARMALKEETEEMSDPKNETRS